VEGTRTVLASCTKAGVKRVALTSSMASVRICLPQDVVFTDMHWSDEDKMREAEMWYFLSKTVAERTAWEMSREEGCPWQLAVLNPTYIFGPMLPGQPSLNTSSSMITAFFDGTMEKIGNEYLDMVDVRDVAEAHVAAIEQPKACCKRFLLIGDTQHRCEYAEIIRGIVPEELKKNIPTEVVETSEEPKPYLYDTSPAEKILDVRLRDLKRTIPDSVQQLLQNGFTSTTQYTPGK